jgi:predicted nucleic acid-binding protein
LVQDINDKCVVLDNNIIFDFGNLDDFHLLNKILANSLVVISPDVKEEIKESINIEKLRFEVAVYTTASDYATHFRLKRTHRGLTHVLSKKLGGICASNDKLTRKIAAQEKIGVIGSIGLLECAIAKKIVTHRQAIDILLGMKKEGAFIDTKLLDDFRERR